MEDGISEFLGGIYEAMRYLNVGRECNGANRDQTRFVIFHVGPTRIEGNV